MAHKAKASDFDIMLCGARVKRKNKDFHIQYCKTCQEIQKKARPVSLKKNNV